MPLNKLQFLNSEVCNKQTAEMRHHVKYSLKVIGAFAVYQILLWPRRGPRGLTVHETYGPRRAHVQ